jgi:hypothetical protein
VSQPGLRAPPVGVDNDQAAVRGVVERARVGEPFDDGQRYGFPAGDEFHHGAGRGRQRVQSSSDEVGEPAGDRAVQQFAQCQRVALRRPVQPTPFQGVHPARRTVVYQPVDDVIRQRRDR